MSGVKAEACVRRELNFILWVPVKDFRQENHMFPAFSERPSDDRIESRQGFSKREAERCNRKIS